MKGLTDMEPSFALGSPLFDKVTIRLNDRYYKGKEFVIEAKDNSTTNGYVQQFRLNGEVQKEPHLLFWTLTEGGNLQMQMGNEPIDNY